MSNCTPKTTLSIDKPTTTTIQNCKSGNGNCSTAGPLDCQDALLGPRPNRMNVKQQLRDYVLLKLGAPVIEIELDEQQLDLAIDEALQMWEIYAPREFYQYYIFTTLPGKSVYEMPPDVGYIRDVFYRETAQFAFAASDLDGVIPVEYFYPGGAFSSVQGGLIDPIQPMWGQMGNWTLYKQYEVMFSRMSSNLGGWEWVGGYNNIKLYPIPCRPQHVIVHYLQKCKDWKNIMPQMQKGSLAYAMIMVGEIRSKFQNIPGPSGGTILNGQDILQRGNDMLEKWQEELISKWGDLLYFSLG